MKSITSLILILFSLTYYSFGQESAQILNEGKKLYRLEKASWLLLHKDYVEWKQHYVMGKKYVSIFDMEKETLAVLTLKA